MNRQGKTYKVILTVFTLLLFISVVSAYVSVTPYGAASTISGSCFLLKTEDLKFIIDCGLFMSEENSSDKTPAFRDKIAKLKNRLLPVELIDAQSLFLTHAHLDHSGRIPLLIHKGFKGKIYSTSATKKLVLTLFRNGNGFELIEKKWFWSKTQRKRAENDGIRIAAHWTDKCKKNIRSIEYCRDEVLLKELEEEKNVKFFPCKKCCDEEVKKIKKRFIALKYGEYIKIADDLAVKLIDAGHIPGSASFIFKTGGKKILFSGDLGSGHSRFNGNFDIPENADLIFMESTCTCDKNKTSAEEYETFGNDLEQALDEGKSIWIPALSLNRTQKILYELKLLQERGRIPKRIPIYSISPSANSITALYQKELKRPTYKSHGDWFLYSVYEKGSILPENVKFKTAKDYDNSQMILISSNGDMDKGRSKQLMPKMLARQDLFIMVVNYVSPESSAGLLLQNKQTRSDLKSSAQIKKYGIFSDHADFETLQKWLSGQNKNVEIYIIHSSEENTQAMVKLLKGKGWCKVKSARIGEQIKGAFNFTIDKIRL